MKIETPNSGRLLTILDTVYGVKGTSTPDGVDVSDGENPKLMDWLQADWPDLLLRNTPDATQEEVDLLKG